MPEDVLAGLDFEPRIDVLLCAHCKVMRATYSAQCTTPDCSFRVIICTRCGDALAAALLRSVAVKCAHCDSLKPALLALVIAALPLAP